MIEEKKNKKKIKNYFELNGSEKTTCKKKLIIFIWNTVKAVLRETGSTEHLFKKGLKPMILASR